MRDGFYRLQYENSGTHGSGVITLHDGILAGCDPFWFMHGTLERDGNRLEGVIVFERHTQRPMPNPLVPDTFEVRLQGFGGPNYGQFDFRCPDVPAIKGRARFTWLGEYQ